MNKLKPALLISFLLVLTTFFTYGQMRIDGSYAFQSNPAKKYSIYIPSGYNPSNPHKLMLGLHPWNTSRWNAESWCDTLIVFAETNNLLLVCPDGDADGKIDDAIDTAFTTNLLDSMEIWYNVDAAKMYVMGFSWGGRTTYTYGLSHYKRFGGFMPIGAAISGTSEVNATLQANSKDKAVYIVHGGSDIPNTRFYPVRTALTNSGAIINSILLPGVGHTIDFANRNQILTTAFKWIDSTNCNPPVGIPIKENKNSLFFPNPVHDVLNIDINYNSPIDQIKIMDLAGRLVSTFRMIHGLENGIFNINLSDLPKGMYFVEVIYPAQKLIFKFIKI